MVSEAKGQEWMDARGASVSSSLLLSKESVRAAIKTCQNEGCRANSLLKCFFSGRAGVCCEGVGTCDIRLVGRGGQGSRVGSGVGRCGDIACAILVK
jgi:hypothetical protein